VLKLFLGAKKPKTSKPSIKEELAARASVAFEVYSIMAMKDMR
jgi:hypothetical protein